jgi:hypothetical protein
VVLLVEQPDSARLRAALAIVRQATVRLTLLAERFSPDGGMALRTVADRLYTERRKRDAHFPSGLFGEPAWDLLLALFVAREDGRVLGLDEAYAAAQVDPGDGPALVDRLVAADMVSRGRGSLDRKSDTLVLTDLAVERLSDYLTGLI